MFHRLTHLGVVVIGLAAVAVLGCGDQKPKGTTPAKDEGPKTQTGQPAAKTVEPVEKKTEPPAAKTAQEPAGKAVEPAEGNPEGAKTGETETAASSGGAGRAVGKVFKRLMKDSATPDPGEAPPFRAP